MTTITTRAITRPPRDNYQSGGFSIGGETYDADRIAAITDWREILRICDRVGRELKAAKHQPPGRWDQERVQHLGQLHQAAHRRRGELKRQRRQQQAPSAPAPAPEPEPQPVTPDLPVSEFFMHVARQHLDPATYQRLALIAGSAALHEPLAHLLGGGVGAQEEQRGYVGDAVQMPRMRGICPLGCLDELLGVLRLQPTGLLNPGQVFAVRQLGLRP